MVATFLQSVNTNFLSARWEIGGQDLVVSIVEGGHLQWTAIGLCDSIGYIGRLVATETTDRRNMEQGQHRHQTEEAMRFHEHSY